MPAKHAPTELRTRRALILSRFSFSDALKMSGIDATFRTYSDPCPSCRATGLNFTLSQSGTGRTVLTDDLTRATRCLCSQCGLRTDAIGFAMARTGTGNPNHMMDKIEDWIHTSKGRDV
ncbi:hypothetical protein [Litorimonas sp. WD9-15]|uniref:hypothetical protein n=1 Tax=Litorimonas sp. WD9-15 TaxID=3418716 RepID=UPI003CFF685E